MKKGTVTVAVYGTLRKGQGNYERILKDNSRFLGTAYTGAPYRMFCVGFPVVMSGTEAEPGLPVEVELYEVSRKTLRRLDRLEGNGRMYQRSRRRFWLNSDDVSINQRAWIYLGKSFSPERMRKVTPTVYSRCSPMEVYVWPDVGHPYRKQVA